MTEPAVQALLDGLTRIVGPSHLHLRAAPQDTALAAWENDWRRRSQGQALLSLRHGEVIMRRTPGETTLLPLSTPAPGYGP